jgi:DNA-binding NarL/FixJ family response regulator
MKATVLIVENHDNFRFRLCDWLRIILPDLDLMEAKSGEEAFNLISTRVPDIVLMDIGLPKINGIEATRRIKAFCPQIQVVILTSYEGPEYEADAAAAGASAFVAKCKMVSRLIPVMEGLLCQKSF